ncbi:hypothetical protein Pr1d_15200 [Bythopirellula goksoeyrii]|uniref:Uncharacterized protein n=1 Tax=Bythopirellula goksoeyrii TaxID=1400387 RepID=A0A5B9QBF1_9BACT|nr:hypothetical protein Pr1d_15200 [Bythopirellula goksoeyrii]
MTPLFTIVIKITLPSTSFTAVSPTNNCDFSHAPDLLLRSHVYRRVIKPQTAAAMSNTIAAGSGTATADTSGAVPY